uniref:Uncharacterized protein n=1 Tax=viral metagenome TaxID=1070528 RepID=A0A6C0CAQ5_9ZZZZ
MSNMNLPKNNVKYESTKNRRIFFIDVLIYLRCLKNRMLYVTI